MFKKVLVPLDGSALSECSLPYIKNLSRDGSIGEVVLLMVAVIDIPYDNVKKDLDFPSFWNAQLDRSRKYLAEVQAKLSADGIKADTVLIETGWPAQVINDFAHKNGVDLIVITSYGAAGLKKLMFGSVALSLLHDSPVPVLLIKPDAC
jgi:nucleotide-binding universal stress UspA family protein